MAISIIIPTYNEEENIGSLVSYLIEHGSRLVHEIIVVDGGSQDSTQNKAQEAGAILYTSEKANRAIQMNLGAQKAEAEILYFVHADTLPPKTYALDIIQAFNEHYDLGCYRFRFDSSRLLLRLNSFFTRFDYDFCRGGDQSLFISKDLFFHYDGYNEQYCIMEEYEFLHRVRKDLRFKIIQKDILVSARKYEENSYVTVQRANFTIFKMYRKGASPKSMSVTYKRLLSHRSL